VLTQFLPSPNLQKEPSLPKPQSSHAEIEKRVDRLTLHDLFRMDFGGPDSPYLQASGRVSVTDNEPRFYVEYDIIKNARDRSKLIAYYVPDSSITFSVCAYLAKQAQFFFDKAPQLDVNTKGIGDSEETSTKDLPFTGRVYVYHETYLKPEQTITLSTMYAAQGQSVIFRSIDYLSNKKLEMKVKGLRDSN
jgi:hypothetical protein